MNIAAMLGGMITPETALQLAATAAPNAMRVLSAIVPLMRAERYASIALAQAITHLSEVVKTGDISPEVVNMVVASLASSREANQRAAELLAAEVPQLAIGGK